MSGISRSSLSPLWRSSAASSEFSGVLTRAVLRDELETLRKEIQEDVAKETQRLLEEHREHLRDEIARAGRDRGHRPDSHGHADSSKSRSVGPLSLLRTKTQSVVVAPVDMESELSDDDQKDQKEARPFLKRNPLIHGDLSSRQRSRQSLLASSLAHERSRSTFASKTSDDQDRRSARFSPLVEEDVVQIVQESTEDEEPVQSNREFRIAMNETRFPDEKRPCLEKWFGCSSQEHCRPWAKHIVHSKTFERLVCIMVFLNAVILGAEIEGQWFKMKHGSLGDDYSQAIQWSEVIFCVVFASELMLRILVDGLEFFVGCEWAWNIYDLIAIVLQILEQALNMCALVSESCMPLHLKRDIRMLRVVRITRLVRLVRLIEELRMIVASITSSMISLAWTCLLLLMLLYSLALFFTEVVLQTRTDQTESKADLEYWFGGLGRTYLTMFECIFGGVSWDEVLNPLLQDVSPAMGWVFCGYIAFCVLAMMNMATGVFVDSAMRKAQEDRDMNTAKRISDLFFNDPELGQAEFITEEQFCSKIDTPEMQDYFKAINVDPSEAKGLYRLLDADESNSIDAAEMVAGCLRLRGGAKALELSLLMHEVSRLHHRVLTFQGRMEKSFSSLVDSIDTEGIQKVEALGNSQPVSSQMAEHFPPHLDGS
mmetsp:Transcript_15730/g.47174  ORF Transcript_15730/g.47174 Transcript_15730/m.47174 type:complete len:655 (+) Transcript_15730:78-2042(+)